MTEHYDVLIATPGELMHAEYVSSLVKTMSAFPELRFKFLNKQSSFVATARELTASDTDNFDYESTQIGGGKFTYNKIFWIDSDIEWTPEDFKKLYDSELDIVSGLYALDNNGRVAVHYPNEHGVPTRVSALEFTFYDEPVEVGGVGFGFLAVKCGVFESIPKPWFIIGHVQWTPEKPMKVNVGEDYSWCGLAQRAGYKIWVDPLVRVKHHKETVFEVII